MWMKIVEAKERLWWVEDMATQNVSEMAEATQIARPSADRKRREDGRVDVGQIASEMPTQKMKQEGDGVRTAALGRVWCRKIFCEMG